jgi:hypothetical protein
VVSDFQMQVGCLAFDRAAKKIVNCDGHSEKVPRKGLLCTLTCSRGQGKQVR